MSQIKIKEMSFGYKKYYEKVFEQVTQTIDTDWKLGLIGRNGRGKTTLLKLLHGVLEPDLGSIQMSVETEWFPYENTSSYRNTMDIIKENIGGLRSMEDQLENLDVLQAYLDLDGFEMESRIKKEINRMELPNHLLERDFFTLSGGEKTKILMIALFLKKNAFILMDEPTNHLDIKGKQEIARYLKKKKGFLVVSHDREFLDQMIDHVISINKSDIQVEKGNYSAWKKNKDIIEAYETSTRSRLTGEVKNLEKQESKARRFGEEANIQRPKNPCRLGAGRDNGAKAYARQAKHSIQLIEEKLEDKKGLLLNYEIAKELNFKQKEPDQVSLIKVNELSYGYHSELLVDKLSFQVNQGDILWIRGKNGSGKSTVLKLLTKSIPNEAVELTEGLQISESYQEALWQEGFIKNYFIKEDGTMKENYYEFLNLCETFDLPEAYLSRPLETFSSGEKKKVDIARALSNKNQLLIMDEPLNFMDVYFKEQLETAILKLKPTMIFVEHDERFGNIISNKILEL